MNPPNDEAPGYRLSTLAKPPSKSAALGLKIEPAPRPEHLAGIETSTLKVVDRKNGMLDRWFPTPESRAKAEAQLALIKTEMEFRERMLLMLRDTQLQTMRENYNVYLKQLKVEGRGSIAVHIAMKLADLQTAMSEQTDRVIAEMEERHAKLTQIKVDSIKAREEERLNQALDSFYSATQKLVNDFIGIVHEDVKSQ
jgi:hypothetical protein